MKASEALSFTKEKFKPGDKVYHIWSGFEVTVLRYSSTVAGRDMFDGVASHGKISIGNDDFCFAGHPILSFLKNHRQKMVAMGFNSIMVGVDGNDNLVAVYFNGHDQYSKILTKNPDVKFLYYWVGRPSRKDEQTPFK